MTTLTPSQPVRKLLDLACPYLYRRQGRYVVVVTGDLAACTAGRISTGKGHVHPHIVSSE